MTDTPAVPAPGHNLPPITKLADEMTHYADLWSHHAGEGEKHENEIKFRAYQLRLYADDPDTELLIGGLLRAANIPQTKRSDLFTQYLHFAFHTAKVRPEKSQISRWAGALKYAWSHDPRPAPESVLGFIKSNGGDVECARKARGAGPTGTALETFLVIPAHGFPIFPPFADGTTIPGRMVKLGPHLWKFEPRKGNVLSNETAWLLGQSPLTSVTSQ